VRRELAIAAAVLVPFAVLVALGFSFSSGGAPAAPGAIRLDPAQPAAPPPARPTGPIVEAPRQASPAVEAALPPRHLTAPLAAITPHVERCFADEPTRLTGHVEARVRFTPTADGRFTAVRVEAVSTPSPWVVACIEDAFAEVGFTPTGAERAEPAVHTFSYEAQGD
jgi:hypothetical protein